MSTDVAVAPDMGRGAVNGVSLESRMRYAEVLSQAGLVPSNYQGKPANVLYALETGTMLGIHPIAAMTGINIISGKPAISPALMTALVRRAGHKVRTRVTGTVEAGDIVAVVEVIRCDDPSFVFSASWSIERAKRAGLWGGRGAWTTYPEAMLKARATGEVCREAAEDALCGMHYLAEELGADVDIEGRVVEGPVTAAPAPRQADPAPAVSPVRDWQLEVESATTEEELRALYRQARDANAPGDVGTAIIAAVEKLRHPSTAASPQEDEPVDAVVVEEPPEQDLTGADEAAAAGQDPVQW